MGDRYGLLISKGRRPEGKNTLQRKCHIIDEDKWFNDLGQNSVSYLWYIPCEQIDYGYTTECRLGMIFFTWCIFKFDCYVTLCSSCHIFIVANNISHIGIKKISCIWVVGDVTNTPDFSDHIQVNCLFLPMKKPCSLKSTWSSKSTFLINGDQMY